MLIVPTAALVIALISYPLSYRWRQERNKRPSSWGFHPHESASTFAWSMAILTLMVGWIYMYGTAYTIPYDEHLHRQEIVSLSDGGFKTTGAFSSGVFAARGYVDSSPVYLYYVKTGDNQYKQKHIPADETTVYEDTEVSGYIEWDSCHKGYTETLMWGRFQHHQRGCWGEHHRTSEYRLHVPPGTIVQDFELGD